MRAGMVTASHCVLPACLTQMDDCSEDLSAAQDVWDTASRCESQFQVRTCVVLVAWGLASH